MWTTCCTSPRWKRGGLLAALLAGAAAPLAAQITEVNRSPVTDISRVTFGYLCDDTFVLRNDGSRELMAELGVTKGSEHSKVMLASHEQLEFTSKEKEDVELWIDGKLVAKAEKEKRACKAVQGNASVAVAPLEVTLSEKDGRARATNYPFYDPWLYGPFGPWGTGWGMYGAWRPRFGYTGFVGVPIVVGTRGGGGRRR
jgi:hypothetical protein